MPSPLIPIAVGLLGAAAVVHRLLKRPLADVGRGTIVAAVLGAGIASYGVCGILDDGWKANVSLPIHGAVAAVGACLLCGPLFFRNDGGGRFRTPFQVLNALAATAGVTFVGLYLLGPTLSGMRHRAAEAVAWNKATADPGSDLRYDYEYVVPEPFRRPEFVPTRLLREAKIRSKEVLAKVEGKADEPIYKDAALAALQDRLRYSQYFDVANFVARNRPKSPEFALLVPQAVDGLMKKCEDDNAFGPIFLLDGIAASPAGPELAAVKEKAFATLRERTALVDHRDKRYLHEVTLEEIVTKADTAWKGPGAADLARAATQALADRRQKGLDAYEKDTARPAADRRSWLWQLASYRPKVRPDDPAFAEPRHRAERLLLEAYRTAAAGADAARRAALTEEVERQAPYVPADLTALVRGELAQAGDNLYVAALERLRTPGETPEATAVRTAFAEFLTDARARPDKEIGLDFATTFDAALPPGAVESALQAARAEAGAGERGFGFPPAEKPTVVEATFVPADGSFGREIERSRLAVARDVLEARLSAAFRGPLLRWRLADASQAAGPRLQVRCEVRYGPSFFRSLTRDERSVFATARVFASMEVRWTCTAFGRDGRELARWTLPPSVPPLTITSDANDPQDFYRKSLTAAYVDQTDRLVRLLGLPPTN